MSGSSADQSSGNNGVDLDAFRAATAKGGPVGPDTPGVNRDAYLALNADFAINFPQTTPSADTTDE